MAKTEKENRFVSDGSGVVTTQCMSCIHHLEKTWVCSAFQSSIPIEIRQNEFDHRESYEGDDGIRYEPIPETPKPYLARLFDLLDTVAPHNQ